MNLLFVCSENKLRSPTGEVVFSKYNELNSLSCGTNSDAETPLSGDLVKWADIIFVMENRHRSKVSKKYQLLLKDKKLTCLDIPDNYQYLDPNLIKLLENRVLKHIRMTLTLR